MHFLQWRVRNAPNQRTYFPGLAAPALSAVSYGFPYPRAHKLGGTEPSTVRTRKQGQAGSRRVKVVCQKCNNEWLSDLEKRTKRLLLLLIHGLPFTLGPDAQVLLATWAAKTIMAAEFVDPTKVAIPPEDRASLMRNLVPPEQGMVDMDGRQPRRRLAHRNQSFQRTHQCHASRFGNPRYCQFCSPRPSASGNC